MRKKEYFESWELSVDIARYCNMKFGKFDIQRTVYLDIFL